MKKTMFFLFAAGVISLAPAAIAAGDIQETENEAIAAEEAAEKEQDGSEFSQQIEISGVVVAVSKDSEGYPQVVKIQNHVISDYGLGYSLLELVGQKVKVSGEIFTDNGGQVLDVVSYELIEDGSGN